MRNGSRTTHGIIDVRLWLMKTDPSTELPQEMLQEARKMLQLILAECEDGNKRHHYVGVSLVGYNPVHARGIGSGSPTAKSPTPVESD